MIDQWFDLEWSVLRFPLDLRFGNVLFCLLFSSLVHALLIVYPYFGKISSNRGETPSQPPRLIATIKPSAHIEATRTSKALHPAHVPSLKIQKPPVSYQFEEALPKGDFAELGDSIPLGTADYYEVSELTAKPQLLDEPIFELGEFADTTAPGKLLLVLRITAQGMVSGVSVDFSDLPESFSQTAIKAFRTLRFVPGELNGEKVDSILRIEIRYDEVEWGVP